MPASRPDEMTGYDTLYVCRPLRNSAAVLDWGRRQGFKSMLDQDDLHVTICYSKAPLDWSALRRDRRRLRITHGPRAVQPLGDEGAVVLRFQSDALSARWQEFREAGASWDYPTYTPHLTLTYDGEGCDLAAMRPYAGPLILGAERFEPLDESWSDKVAETVVTETARTAPNPAAMRQWIDAVAGRREHGSR